MRTPASFSGGTPSRGGMSSPLHCLIIMVLNDNLYFLTP